MGYCFPKLCSKAEKILFSVFPSITPLVSLVLFGLQMGCFGTQDKGQIVFGSAHVVELLFSMFPSNMTFDLN